MNKATNKKSIDPSDRIPTLTEIVGTSDRPVLEPSLAAPPAPDKAAKASAGGDLPKDLAETVDRLVYKALYRQLPALSKEIGAEIINTLEKQLRDKKSR
ncbi:MAG TPA: hypothetical protein VFX02_12315 [Gammaproteobacteria bacterium]|nr:hypothetical protein [Gammaproteobacteria bacterium]